MKRLLLFASALLLSVSMFSCSKGADKPDPQLEVPTTPIEAIAGANDYMIAVKSNGNWLAEVVYKTTPDSEWITLEGTPGEENGTIIVKVAANTAFEPREAQIKVTMEGLAPVLVPLTQAAASVVFDVDDTPVTATVAGGTYTIDVTSNIAWSAELTEIAPEGEWISIAGETGTGNGQITVTVLENETNVNRTAKVVVSAEGEEPFEVTVQQNAGDLVFNLSKTELHDIPAVGETYTIEVTSNAAWTLEKQPGRAWVSLDKTSGSGNGSFTVTVAETEEMTGREATITATPEGGTAMTITVKQSGKPAVLAFGPKFVAKMPLTIIASGGYVQGDIDANIEWKLTSSEAWLTCSPATGTGYTDQVYLLKYSANPGFTPLTTTVTLSAVDESLGVTPVTVEVTQAAKVAQLAFQEFEKLTFPAEPGDNDAIWMYVLSNLDWKLTASESWLVLPLTSGTNSNGGNITATANTTTATRTATLTLEATTVGANVAPVTVTFTQAGKPVQGVSVAGVTWAPFNLMGAGKFVGSMEEPGAIFQYNSNTAYFINTGNDKPAGWRTAMVFDTKWATDPCPTGWRLPVIAEFESLVALGSANKRIVKDAVVDILGDAHEVIVGYWLGDNADNVAAATYADPKGCIFMPSTGARQSNGTFASNTVWPAMLTGTVDIPTTGFYYSSSSNGGYMWWPQSGFLQSTPNAINKNNGNGLRCVKAE